MSPADSRSRDDREMEHIKDSTYHLCLWCSVAVPRGAIVRFLFSVIGLQHKTRGSNPPLVVLQVLSTNYVQLRQNLTLFFFFSVSNALLTKIVIVCVLR